MHRTYRIEPDEASRQKPEALPQEGDVLLGIQHRWRRLVGEQWRAGVFGRTLHALALEHAYELS